MNHGPLSLTDEVERYLLTGQSDPVYSAWPGNVMERAVLARAELRGALIAAVKRKQAKGERRMPVGLDALALTRAKVEPMVRGLFPAAERSVVLAMLEKSVVFLTSGNIETVLFEESFDCSAWILANLYLAGLGRELLSPDAPNVAGLSQDTTCYVSPQYFEEKERFADFIVHEAAHVFHNCKRGTLGLRETRSKVWLLDIEYRKRETFAYSCEAYARILELGASPAARQALADEFSRSTFISDERVDGDEVARIASAAAAARNGWRVILAHCAPAFSKKSDQNEKIA